MIQMTKATVIIPVKNGGEILKKVVDKVLSQKLKGNFELVVVDSGSTDGSLEFLKNHPDKRVKILKISPKEFGHGKTRNFAVSKAKGEFVAFITQDALPASNKWLQKLIDAFKESDIVGVFGKHIPYENTYPVEKKQIVEHFDKNFGKKWLKFKIKDKKDYEARKGWYIYYSDNNSCMRKDILQKIPFRNFWMGEDQFWARDILEAGYAKAYEPEAAVYHSHKYSFREIIKRYYDEYRLHVEVGNATKAGIKDALRFFMHSYKYSLKTIFELKTNIFKKIYWMFFYFVYDLARTYGYYIGTNGTNEQDETMSMQSEIINR